MENSRSNDPITQYTRDLVPVVMQLSSGDVIVDIQLTSMLSSNYSLWQFLLVTGVRPQRLLPAQHFSAVQMKIQCVQTHWIFI
jgi:hypothetical protein